VLQAHAIQIQTLQNELESLRAQLANLKGKSSQLARHAQLVQGLGSRVVSHTMPWLGNMLFLVHTILVLH
jgi:prefoldin subunit 5